MSHAVSSRPLTPIEAAGSFGRCADRLIRKEQTQGLTRLNLNIRRDTFNT